MKWPLAIYPQFQTPRAHDVGLFRQVLGGLSRRECRGRCGGDDVIRTLDAFVSAERGLLIGVITVFGPRTKSCCVARTSTITTA